MFIKCFIFYLLRFSLEIDLISTEPTDNRIRYRVNTDVNETVISESIDRCQVHLRSSILQFRADSTSIDATHRKKVFLRGPNIFNDSC